MYLIIHFGVIYFTVITRYQIINNENKFNMKIIERTISTERPIKKYKSQLKREVSTFKRITRNCGNEFIILSSSIVRTCNIFLQLYRVTLISYTTFTISSVTCTRSVHSIIVQYLYSRSWPVKSFVIPLSGIFLFIYIYE